MRIKKYWKDAAELAKRSELINDDCKSLVRLAVDGFSMNTQGPHGNYPVRFFMGHMFLFDLGSEFHIQPVRDAIF